MDSSAASKTTRLTTETSEAPAQIASLPASPLKTGQRAGGAARIWDKLKLFFKSSFFWHYGRGGWQYDVICLVIVAFIFLTPRAWFGDRPTLQLSDLRHLPGVIEIRNTKSWRSYQIDARLVDSTQATNPEQAIRKILQTHLKKAPEIESIQTIRDKDQVILGYTVVIAQ